MWSYLFGYIVKGGMQQEIVERRSRHQTIRTWLSFKFSTLVLMPPLQFRQFSEYTKKKLPTLSTFLKTVMKLADSPVRL